MFPTIEIRWFGRGNTSRPIRQWFEQYSECPIQTCSTDYYFHNSKNYLMNVKLRNSSIEIKYCTYRHKASLSRNITGFVEHWRKWRFTVKNMQEAIDTEISNNQSWIGVEKRRKINRCELTSDGKVRMTKANESPVCGLNFELTDIHLTGSKWWTLSLEAFGMEHTLEKTFNKITSLLSSTADSCIQTPASSCSYTEWLGKTINNEFSG